MLQLQIDLGEYTVSIQFDQPNFHDRRIGRQSGVRFLVEGDELHPLTCAMHRPPCEGIQRFTTIC